MLPVLLLAAAFKPEALNRAIIRAGLADELRAGNQDGWALIPVGARVWGLSEH